MLKEAENLTHALSAPGIQRVFIFKQASVVGCNHFKNCFFGRQRLQLCGEPFFTELQAQRLSALLSLMVSFPQLCMS